MLIPMLITNIIMILMIMKVIIIVIIMTIMLILMIIITLLTIAIIVIDRLHGPMSRHYYANPPKSKLLVGGLGVIRNMYE